MALIGQRLRSVFAGQWVLLAAALCTAGTASADNAQALLERMVNEGGQVSFRGTLVHLCGGKIDVVNVVHRFDDGRVTERVKTMDANGREIIHSSGKTMCIMPDQKMVMVAGRGRDASHADRLLAPTPSFASANAEVYRLTGLGEESVAGHSAQIVAISPNDEYRYGYRLWLHPEHAMALKYELVAGDGSALEQTLFTEIEFPERIVAAEVEPTIATDGFVWKDVGGAMSDASPEPIPSRAWGANDVPAGFDLVLAEALPSEDGTIQHLVYSDGLAAVSVFIEGGIDAAEQNVGRTELGAVNAYTTTVDGFMITAIGDVPMGTAKMIALSVAPL